MAPGTTGVVEARYQPEPADLVDALEAANAAVRHRRRHLRTWWYIVLLLVLVVAGLVLVLHGAVLPGVILLVAGFGSAILQGGFAAPVADVERAVSQAWDADPRLHTARAVVVGAEGWQVRADDGVATFPWSAVHHVTETERSFLLANVQRKGINGVRLAFYVLVTASRPSQTTVMPKRALAPDDVARLRQVLAEHVPASRLTLP